MSEPEILDDERTELERRGSVDLMQLPRLLGGALTDLRTIATHITTLPSLLVNLEHINERVASLDEEVKQMRAAVETMGGDVVKLGGGIDRLETTSTTSPASPTRCAASAGAAQPPSSDVAAAPALSGSVRSVHVPDIAVDRLARAIAPARASRSGRRAIGSLDRWLGMARRG